jgi:hypothetical protein
MLYSRHCIPHFYPIFVPLKKIIRISFSFLMVFCILFGYAGVTVYKMICSEDGSIKVSLMHDDAACHHSAQKDCCKPVPVKPAPEPKDCCDYQNAFLQLDEISPVYEQQNSTGHILAVTAILFSPFSVAEHSSGTLSSTLTHAPPLLRHKQSQQSITQVFRI